MKTLQNNFTTPEQSKRLLELGVPEDSADCYYYDCDRDRRNPHVFDWHDREISDFKSRLYGAKKYPCWSVGRLAQITLICSGSSKVEMMFKTKDTDLIESFIDDIHLLKEFGRLDFSKLNDK